MFLLSHGEWTIIVFPFLWLCPIISRFICRFNLRWTFNMLCFRESQEAETGYQDSQKEDQVEEEELPKSYTSGRKEK